MILRVLVADDEQDVRDYLTQIVPRLGHQVVGCAADGRELVDLALQTTPDVIVTDIRMPILSGIQAVKEIAHSRPTPTVFVTAHFPESLDSLPRHVVLRKPIRRTELAAAITEVTRTQTAPAG